jgi:pimeloyl-ACP methyl ester carboxylesterase
MESTRGKAARGAPALRRAGRAGGPALWLVHALGDSGRSWEALLATSLGSSFELLAPDWPGAGAVPAEPDVVDLDGLARWLARLVARHSPAARVGLVGHSLGAAAVVRATRRLGSGKVAGVFSIEGNLTAADAYLSGLATACDTALEYRDRLRARVRTLAEQASDGPREALSRYHEALGQAAPEPLWRIARSAAAASRGDALGEEYRALEVPTFYYWSRENTPEATRAYLASHALHGAEFAGGHWPMIERPEETARAVADFFRPLA